MGGRDHTVKVTRVITVVAAALLLMTTVALARRHDHVWMDGLISRVEPRFREMTIWDYQGGVSKWDLTVPGSVNLRDLQVGDLVRVVVDRSRRTVFRLHKLPAPAGDDRYWEAVRRLKEETGKPGPSP